MIEFSRRNNLYRTDNRYSTILMKPSVLSLLIATLALSPLAFAENTEETPNPTQQTSDGLRISGGDGKTKETAIILGIEGPEVIRLEHLIYAAVYKTRPATQALQKENGRVYDVLIGDDESQVLYFDITAYWQHCYGATSETEAE